MDLVSSPRDWAHESFRTIYYLIGDRLLNLATAAVSFCLVSPSVRLCAALDCDLAHFHRRKSSTSPDFHLAHLGLHQVYSFLC